MSYADKSDFDRERDKLVAEIAENLGKCVSAVNQLNRNIENVTQVGDGFEPVHTLWSQFQDVMQSGQYGGASEEQPPAILQRNDDTVRLPAGLAPGGGETVLNPPTAHGSASDGSP